MDVSVSPLLFPNVGPFIKSANEFELASAEGEGCLLVGWPLVLPNHFKEFLSEKLGGAEKRSGGRDSH